MYLILLTKVILINSKTACKIIVQMYGCKHPLRFSRQSGKIPACGVLLQCLCPSAMIIMEERHNGTMQTKNKSPDL